VFSSPSSQQCFEAIAAVNGGPGVLLLYGNYGGDVLNFDLATDQAELEDIAVRTVLGRDDVASQPKQRKGDRRGVAGIFFAYKAAGAAAERGDNLEQVAAVAEDVVEHTATMGIGLSPTILPTTGASSCRMARWRSASGFTASRESTVASWTPQMPSPTGSSPLWSTIWN
jgi:dihydroxyacetone kinase/dihydroxyacetone kinase-like protein